MHTVIIGGGFAGIKAALELANKQTGKITLISNSPYFNCHASLYSILAGKSKRQSKVTLSDITTALKGYRKKIDFTDYMFTAIDFNDDGEFKLSDIVSHLKYYKNNK